MHQAIEDIIDRLVGAITADKPYYQLNDLLSAGIPAFIVERVLLEMNQKLQSDLQFPASKWVNEDSELIRESWQDFVLSCTSASHIPKSELYHLLGDVVEQIVKVYLEPRKHMASYIFQGDEELSAGEAERRCSALTIYRHFAKAVPLYMQKKKLKQLSRERCERLIENLDNRLVASYEADDWERILEPIFILFGGKVDASLLSLYFRDKNLNGIAERICEERGALSRARLYSILKDPEVDIRAETKEAPVAQTPEPEEKNEAADKSATAVEEYADEPVSDEPAPVKAEKVTDLPEVETAEEETSLMENFIDDFEESSIAYSEEEAENLNSFNELFQAEEEPDEDEAGTKASGGGHFHDKLTSVLDQAKDSYKNLSEEEGGEEPENEDNEQKPESRMSDEESAESPFSIHEDAPTAAPDDSVDEETVESEEDDDQPMWKQFLSEDQMDLIMADRETPDDEAAHVFTESDSDFDSAEEDSTETEDPVSPERERISEDIQEADEDPSGKDEPFITENSLSETDDAVETEEIDEPGYKEEQVSAEAEAANGNELDDEPEPEQDLNSIFASGEDDETNGIWVGDEDFIDDPIGDAEAGVEENAGNTTHSAQETVYSSGSGIQVDPENNEEKLKKHLESGNRKKYIKKIFGKSAGAYNSAVSELAACATWQEASGHLRQEIFEKHDVDMFSDEAVEFTDRLQLFFDKKS